jgi:ankyrin repeat protein|tara:strand:+ start:119555 stop:120076 length:522 start_codon:yes stop_codon:yes gene_type:complete
MYGICTSQLSDFILDCSRKNEDQHIDYYIQFGGDASRCDEDGRNAAHHFAMRGNAKGLNALALDDMTPFEKADKYGMTPLMYLAERSTQDVMPYAVQRPQLLAQTDLKHRSIAGFIAAKGDLDTVLGKMMPICPEIRFQRIISMVMSSLTLDPMEKIRMVRILGHEGFETKSI